MLDVVGFNIFFETNNIGEFFMMAIKYKGFYYILFRDIFFILLCCNLLQTVEYVIRSLTGYYNKSWLKILTSIDLAVFQFHIICILICSILILYLLFIKADISCFLSYFSAIAFITLINIFLTPVVTVIT
jgi:hypothetical protein